MRSHTQAHPQLATLPAEPRRLRRARVDRLGKRHHDRRGRALGGSGAVAAAEAQLEMRRAYTQLDFGHRTHACSSARARSGMAREP
eukprot:scaffold117691_cov77-Phaeocystis_antarctica.AAC.1